MFQRDNAECLLLHLLMAMVIVLQAKEEVDLTRPHTQAPTSGAENWTTDGCTCS